MGGERLGLATTATSRAATPVQSGAPAASYCLLLAPHLALTLTQPQPQPGVYCLSLHPTLDLLVTGGRDCVARVWDVRTKNAVHTLCGHQQTVASVETQALTPSLTSSLTL